MSGLAYYCDLCDDYTDYPNKCVSLFGVPQCNEEFQFIQTEKRLNRFL